MTSLVTRASNYAEMARPRNAAAGGLGFSVGYFFNDKPLSPAYFITGLIIVVLIHSAVTIQNDIQDLQIDKANHRQTLLTNDLVGGRSLSNMVLLMFCAALLIALISPDRLINEAFIAGFILLSWLYNMPPAYLSRRPIVSIVTMGICYGALPVMYGFTVGGGGFSYSLLLAAVWFLVRASTSIMKDFKDAAGDLKYGKRTFYLAYGVKSVSWISLSFAVAAYLAVIVLLNIKLGFGWQAVLIIPLALLAVRNLYLRLGLFSTSDSRKLARIFSRSFYYQNQFDLAILLCLIIF